MKIIAKKILIVRLSSLGDILLTTPVIRAIKYKNIDVKIDFLLRKTYHDTVKYNPHLNNVMLFENFSDTDTLINFLKKEKYDYVVDLQNNLRSRKIVSKLDIPKFVYQKNNIKKFLLVNFNINLFKKITSITEKYATAIPDLQIDDKSTELIIPNKVTSTLKRENLIGFCPGSRHFTKMWPENYFIELGNRLTEADYRIILFGGKSDIEICTKISNKINGSVNLVNENKLLQTAVDMKECKIIVCNDSGMMHTAVSVGVPVAAIFGSTVKEFGFSPNNSKNIILENNSVSCRPCSHIGLEKCPKKHFNCMNLITPELAYQQIQNFMQTL